jgi:hypothetical protein
MVFQAISEPPGTDLAFFWKNTMKESRLAGE